VLIRLFHSIPFIHVRSGAALAHSFKELGDTKLAVSYLEKYHQIATKNKQQVAQAEACAALGAIYSAQGNTHTPHGYGYGATNTGTCENRQR